MECKDVNTLFDDFYHGHLKGSKKEGIVEHLAGCTPCSKAYDTYVSLLDFIEEDRHVDVNPFLYTRIRAKMETPVKNRANIPILQKTLWALSFSFVLLLGVYAGYTIGSSYTENKIWGKEYSYIEDGLFYDDMAINIMDEMMEE